MKTYLVTGAAGFIGAAVANALIKDGNKVVTIDNLSTGTESNIPDGCVFIKGNDYEPDIIKELDSFRFDAIIHIAGQSSGEISFDNPVYDLQTNTQSTLLLLDYAKKTGCKKFVYASSMSTYGEVADPFVDETTELIPKSFYAVGKIASEHYMRIYSSFGIDCTALRFFNVYGIGQNMENLRQGMASIFMAMAINDKHITVKGGKDRFRDFVNIDDVVKAVLLSVNSEKAGYNCYNVCTARKTTVEELIEQICSNLDYPVQVEFTENTPGDQHGIYGSYAKIKDDLGWEPTVEFNYGIKQMVDWAVSELKK